MQGSDIVRRRDLRRLEFPSSADLLMQGNWPIYQNHEETELQSHRCIKNGSAGPERGSVGKGGGGQIEEEEEEDEEGGWVSSSSGTRATAAERTGVLLAR